MNAPLLIVRTDASSSVGSGHVMRCLALAQAWITQQGRVLFVCNELPQAVANRLSIEGIEVKSTRSISGTKQDARDLATAVLDFKADALVVDGYKFDAEYLLTISECGCVTLTIDDYGHLPRYTTCFVLNQNLGASVDLYPGKSETTNLLLGTEYALLRRELLSENHKQERFEANDGELCCLVTLGGSDPNNVTATVIKGLLLLNDPKMKVRVVLGGMNPHAMSMEKLISGDRRFSVLQNASNMAEHYAWANFAIAAGGSSNWEMCYFGLPRIVVVIADNQRLIAEQLAHEGIAISLGESSRLTPEQVANAVKGFWNDKNLLNHATRRSKELVDGLGAMRVVNHLLSAICH